MPWGYVAAYYYAKSKKRQAQQKSVQARRNAAASGQQSFLDLLNASKTTNLSDKDAELLVSNDTVQHGTESDNYLGPPFGTSDDYIEVLIYDTQNNFLESGVVEPTDYFFDEEEGGIKIKTGTVLRKMGYDIGRFKVLYNFLRKVAGSYETVVTDTNGNVISGEIDENEIGSSLFLKENKYNIHEISDSRTELRLITQNIKDEGYLRRFYKLGSKETKFQADETPMSNIEFVGTAEEKSTSKEIKFISTTGMSEGRFDQSMRGGKIIIPNFFVIAKNDNAIPKSGEDLGYLDYEVVNGTELRSSFRMVGIETGTELRNENNQFGDRYLGTHHQFFEGLSYDDIIINPLTGEQITSDFVPGTLREGSNTTEAYELGLSLVHTDLASQGAQIGDFSSRIYNVYHMASAEIFNYFKASKQGGVVIFDFESNSVFESDSAVEYTWEVFGWDRDGGSNSRKYELNRKFGTDGTDLQGNIKIFGGSEIGDNRYADEATSGAGMVAKKTVSPNDFDRTAYAENSRPGCRLRVGCYSKDTHIGVQLTVKDNTRNVSRTTALPAFIWVVS